MVVNKIVEEINEDSDHEVDDLVEYADFEKLPKEQKELLNRLYKFVICFVEEMETRLVTYHKVFEGKLKNEEFPENVAKLLGTAAGGILHVFFGSTMKVPAKMTSVGVEKLVKLSMEVFGDDQHDDEKFHFMELVYGFINNVEKGRMIFARIALEVFYSFEMQFLRATSNRGYRKAMRLLAVDSVNRFLSCFDGKESCSIVTMNVLDGESKISPFIPSSIKSPGLNILYEYKDKNKDWNTCKLYEKTGILKYSNDEYEFYKRKSTKCEKYGFRRLLINENVNEEYILDNTEVINDWLPYYIGDLSYYKNHLEPILNCINRKDKYMSEDRIIRAINLVKNELLNEIKRVRLKEIVPEEFLDALNKLESLFDSEQTNEILNCILNDQKQLHERLNYAIEHREVIATDMSSRFDILERAIKSLSVNPDKDVLEKNRIIFRLMSPVKSFTGRIMELEQIREKFENDKGLTVISQTASITGFGGIGKSELAKKYAEVYLEQRYYKNVVFINTENRENILDSFKALAGKMNVPIVEIVKEKQEDRDIRCVVEEIYEVFDSDNGKTLLILDNACNYGDVKDFLPRYYSPERKTHVLITSRCQSWNVGELGKIEVIPLNLFTKEEAFEFVSNVLRNENVYLCQNDDEINELTERLQYFPLALKQATGFIKHRNSMKPTNFFTIKDYLKLFEQQTEQLLKDGHCENEEYGNKTVMTTWTVAVESIRKNKKCGELAVKIFNIIAYISSDYIQVDELFSSMEANNKMLWNAVNLLYNYSLITLQNSVISVHRLMQEVLRLNLRRRKKEKHVLKQVLDLLNRKNFTEHIISAWTHAVKYPKLIRERYPLSFYGITLDKPLHILSMYGNNCNTIEAILSCLNFEHVDDRNKYYETPLYRALCYGNVNVVKFLMNKSASMDVCSVSGMTPLHVAAFYGHEEIVLYIKNFKPDLLKCMDRIERKPLDLAVLRGHIGIIKSLADSSDICEMYLFHAKIKNFIHCQDHDGFFDMMKGMKNKELIESKLNGRTVLHMATTECDLIVVQTLIDYGANVDCVDENGCTPLHYTSSLRDTSYFLPRMIKVYDNNMLIMKLLLESGADPNSSSNQDERPLHHALYKKNMKAFKLLLEYNADIYALDRNGSTPLILALWTQNPAAVEILLKMNAFNDIKNLDDREKILHVAVRSKNTHIIKLLLDNGADIFVNDALVLNFISNDDVDGLKLLLSYKSDSLKSVSLNYIISVAVLNRSKEMLRFILDNGMDPGEESKYLQSVLYKAIRYDFTLDFLSYLLEKGASLNEVCMEDKTSLQIAVSHGNIETIKFLLEKGAKSPKWDLIRTCLRNKNMHLAIFLMKTL